MPPAVRVGVWACGKGRFYGFIGVRYEHVITVGMGQGEQCDYCGDAI